jgi:hypothetical protein
MCVGWARDREEGGRLTELRGGEGPRWEGAGVGGRVTCGRGKGKGERPGGLREGEGEGEAV